MIIIAGFNYTFQDFEEAANIGEFLQEAIDAYLASDIYMQAVQGENYYRGQNDEILKRQGGLKTANGRELKTTTPITTGIFKRLIIQQNSTLLSSGAIITDEDGNDLKPQFGKGFDRAIMDLGLNALKHGVSYGYWDYDTLLTFSALELFTLNDERSNVPLAAVRFWSRINAQGESSVFIELYELDGVTEYRIGNQFEETTPKQPYRAVVRPITGDIESIEEFSALPIVPFWGNSEHVSELTMPIKSKIDLMDIIWTNFGDSAGRFNIIYWILNNFSLDKQETLQIIEEIQELGIISSQDGDNTSAEPRVFELPTESVEKALRMIELSIYSDFMGVDMNTITGGSLTNVAINTAYDNLNKKVAEYFWQPFNFVQRLMLVMGLKPTEVIDWKSVVPRNEKEYSAMIIEADQHLDHQTILEKLPFVEVDEPSIILDRFDKQVLVEGENMYPFEKREE